MESKAILRLFFQLLLAFVALAALPVEAGAAPPDSESTPTPADAAYQRLIDATSAVVAVKVKAIPNAHSNGLLGQERSGAALINKDGELVGIGSLLVMDAFAPGERLPGNMFVPVDLLKPVLDELMKSGSQSASRRPWLGVNSLEEDGRVKVMQVNEESPAQQVGIVAGDIILSVNGEPVASLDMFYDKVWKRGPPGSMVTLTVLHGTTLKEVAVRSIDRREFMRRKSTI